MLLVLLIHYVGTITVDSETIRTSTADSLVTIELHSLSVVCVNCFILISGYFGIKWRTKSIISLLYQVIFWLIVGLLLARSFGFPGAESSVKIVMDYFGSRWFVPAYLGLYILSPLLNAFIEQSSKKGLGWYIILFYAYSTVVGYLIRSQEFNEGMSVISLVGLYMIGSYLRISRGGIFGFKPLVDLGIYVVLSVLLAACNAGLLYVGFGKSPFGYLNPIVIVMSVYLFLFFQKLKIGEIKWINVIAASAFAVYLFHMHPSLWGMYQDICKRIHSEGVWAMVWLPAMFVTIFIISIIIDRIRIVSFGIIWNNILKR